MRSHKPHSLHPCPPITQPSRRLRDHTSYAILPLVHHLQYRDPRRADAKQRGGGERERRRTVRARRMGRAVSSQKPNAQKQCEWHYDDIPGAAMTDIIMPAGGMAMTEGLVVEWLKQPGDHVAEGEPVVEIETDKATVQIESPASGILGDHRYSVGDVVPVGEVLATVLEPGEAPRAPAPGPDSEPKDRGKGVEPKDEGSHAGQQPGRTAGRTPVPEDLTATRESHRLSPRARREAKATPREMEEARSIETHGGQPVDSVLSHKLLEGFLQDMVLIREFERVATELSHRGKIPGGMHSAAGQEAVAVGSIGALRNTDIVCSSHRSHHHAIAKGLTPRSIMAELYGKATGCLGGRGGHMHLADFSIGLYGSNGIVGRWTGHRPRSRSGRRSSGFRSNCARVLR